MAAFAELAVMPEIVRAVEELGWLLPTNIQAEAIPQILGGGDVLMAAETGSGKTGAFCLPVLQIAEEYKRTAGLGGSKSKKKTAAAAEDAVTLSSDDRDALIALSDSGLDCQVREAKLWQGARATAGAIQGQHYYEARVTNEGLCRIGWAAATASLDLGTDKNGFGFGGTGKKSHNRQFDDYGEAFGADDVIGCYFDADNHQVFFSKNGNVFDIAFEVPPHLHKSALYPAVVLKNSSLRLNFGAEPFAFPPAGKYSHFKGIGLQLELCLSASAAATHTGPRKGPLALILEPSQELARQTFNQIELFAKHIPSVKQTLLVGGASAKDQIKDLDKVVDIVTGTPGRIKDLVDSGKLDLSSVMFYVLDEVDGLLNQGHLKFLESLYRAMPKAAPDGRRLQLIVASATLHSPEVKSFAENFMFHPVWIDLKGLDSVPDTVHHVVCLVNPVADRWWVKPDLKGIETDGIHARDKTGAQSASDETYSEAVKILKLKYLLNAIKACAPEQAIIFCRTKVDCDHTEHFLNTQGGGGMVNEYSACCVHGEKGRDRQANLDKFKNGEIRFLICTDVAARGIDVQGVPCVINMTLPPTDEKANYVHRIGRVGRAERMGLAISIVADVKEKVWYHQCKNRNKDCHDTRLLKQGGCAIWFDEKQYLADIEEHLGVSIPLVGSDFSIPVNEFDGKVVYGEKRTTGNETQYKGHADQLAPSVKELSALERQAQESFLTFRSRTWN
eukprot:m.161786 g.161786  ORF g.161786 m.161786 type:complete len:730 (-) comp20982_c0_seq2:69-2258(-)